MPYSKSKIKSLAAPVMWPDLRYGPNGECKLFHNEGAHQNHWLEIRLIGTRSNRDGTRASSGRRRRVASPRWKSA